MVKCPQRLITTGPEEDMGKALSAAGVRNPGVSYLQLEAGCVSMGHSTAGAQTSKSRTAHE